MRRRIGLMLASVGGLLIVAGAVAAALPPGGTFSDDDGNPHEGMIEAILEHGVTEGCDAGRYCPDAPVTRGQMASFLARAFDLPPGLSDAFGDDDTNAHQAGINALAAAGITQGCADGLYCPDAFVPRAQMATFLARAMHLEPLDNDPFTDDDGSVHEGYIAALAAAGVTAGCDTDRYCPTEDIPRDQMASLIGRALGLAPVDVPPPTTTLPSTTTTTIADDGQGWGCHPAYIDCVPNHPDDVDCAGGTGNGPVYVEGPVRVKTIGIDPYDLDRDNDGIGCEP